MCEITAYMCEITAYMSEITARLLTPRSGLYGNRGVVPVPGPGGETNGRMQTYL